MLIDWFTVIAQLINFVILAVALKLLLYDRIVDAMEKRAKTIAARERAAEQAQQAAEGESERLEEERRQFRDERNELLEQAREEARERGRQLLEEARAEVEDQERRWQESLHSKREKLLAELQAATGEKSITIARRALRDLADADLEREVVDRFLHRLDRADDGTAEILEILRREESPLLVRTAFDLSDDHREQIRKTLRELIADPEREIEWEHDRDLIAGIVIRVGEQRIGWTVGSYLGHLGDQFGELLRDELGERIDSGATEGEG